MARHLTAHRSGFPLGWTQVTDFTDTEDNTGMRFSILRLQEGQKETLPADMELAVLHLDGKICIDMPEEQVRNQRDSLFDESPFAVHVCKGTQISVAAESPCEIAVFQIPNDKTFPIAAYRPKDTPDEHRGKGQVADTSLRFVRTIFDGENSHPDTQLVLGEVINFPGRWSSYPPHHHPQPEIYHYRFTHPQGYGHGELGDDVYKIKQGDTVKILDELDHAQCSAPGYGMYYIWAIRHLEHARYTVPVFTDEHRWTMQAGASIWAPKEEVMA